MICSRFRGFRVFVSICLFGPLLAIGCGGGSEESASGGKGEAGERSASSSNSRGGPGAGRPGAGGRPGGGRPGSGGPPGVGGSPGGDSRGVPVEVATVSRQAIALYFETNGTLEAENEVDLVARAGGPIVELKAEEGMRVKKGDLLARIDDREIVAEQQVSQVRLEEAKQSYERIKALHAKELVSRDSYDEALAAYDSARGDFERLEVQLQYTRIRAPFAGQVVSRYVRFAEHLANGARMFRLSDFDPLLCPIQVPERELERLATGQRAELEVAAFPGRRFAARVLRISPVVDSATGTVKVTLQAVAEGKLRPGMFASVFLELDRRDEAVVVPKSALALDSLGNTVFVAKGGVAQRRELTLGFRNEDMLEVRSGVSEGEEVIVVGQDGLSEGTPVEILEREGAADASEADASESVGSSGGPPAYASPGASARGPGGRDAGGRDAGGRDAGGRGAGGRGAMLRNIDWNDPEQIERIKSRMRERGLNDQEIEQRLERMRARSGGGDG